MVKLLRMKLADWIEKAGITRAEFAKRIDVSGPLVTQYCDGQKWPGRDKIESIVRETAGAVTANDFLPDETAETIAQAVAQVG